MKTEPDSAERAARPGAPPVARLQVLLALTVFAGAFLLFQVQPLLGKYILPWYGGSPAVWTTCMLFFQVMLCAGYAYAHALEHYVWPRWRTPLHLGLIVAAVVLLPVAPTADWQPPLAEEAAGLSPAARIMLMLAACTGLQYFLLASTGPLVQAWFSRAVPDRSPYPLYALSNAASLLALVSYPVVVEPALPVDAQAWWWSVGFAAFCCLLAGALWQTRLPGTPALNPAADTIAADDPAARVGWSRRLAWIGLPALASMMLLAATQHVCQDVASVPLLWVVPLGLYLVSFIITFAGPRAYWRVPCGVAALVALYLLIGLENIEAWRPPRFVYELAMGISGQQVRPWLPRVGYGVQLIACFTALFLLCMVCHGELFRLRPAPRALTGYYLWISIGGALGGLFVSLLAPMLFDTFFEWKLGLILGFVLAGWVVFAAPWIESRAERAKLEWQGLLSVAGLFLAGLALVDAISLLQPRVLPTDRTLARDRGFFGTLRVDKRSGGPPEMHNYALYNGHIIHGEQIADPARSRWATTYYSQQSGIGRVLDFYRRRGPIRAGLVGLGIGTLASYAEQGDEFRFYEINPQVIRLAEKHFTFLPDARKRGSAIELVTADARLALANEPAQKFDVLVLDAFSGDAIPNHLLTSEAFEIYLRHLDPQGAIAVHVTNRHLRLSLVVRGVARSLGWPAVRVVSPPDPMHFVAQADWVIVTRNQELLAELKRHPAATDNQPTDELPLWTDQQHNLFQILE